MAARLALAPVPGDRRRRRVGLLGGSFNPAHGGHLHVSEQALMRLALDEIWWLVSPQNPLKSARGMASLDRRLDGAAALVGHRPRIKVTDLETRLGTRFTADTLAALRRRFPATCFVWLMGADNLIQIPRWQRWTDIFAHVPIAVFDRPGYAPEALRGMAATRYRQARRPDRARRRLASLGPPCWSFFAIKLEELSATSLRARARRMRFLGRSAARLG